MIQNKPGYKRAWQFRSRSHAALGQFSDALADITYAIGIEPRDDYSVVSRGHIHSRLGNYQAALIDFRTAAEINPADPSYTNMANSIQDYLSKQK